MPGRSMSKNKATLALVVIGIMVVLLVVLPTFRTSDRPNLVLIVIDTLRADRLSCYGYDRIRTPNFDALAESGVRFENATAHVPITLPSLATIMTSTLPPATGVHNNENYYLDDSARTLAEILREEGYWTGAVIGAMVLDSINGISQGFGRYDDDFAIDYIGYQDYSRRVRKQLNLTQRRADEVTGRALAMTHTMGDDSPFFLFVHYFDPHIPYDPPPPHSSVDPDLVPDSIEFINRLYDGEVAFTDDHIGNLLEGLRSKNLLENTLVVLTSDHGEDLFDHGEKTHAYFTYESTLRVPLIFSMPGTIPGGTVHRALARHVDLVPTILDILGVQTGVRHGFHGETLFPLAETDDSALSYFESAMPYLMFEWSGLRGVRSREWKYIDAPREELYHLASDPGERHNIIEERPDMADSLRGEMDRILAGMEISSLGEGQPEPAADGAGRVDRSYRERLRALGYIGEPRQMGSTYEEMFDRSLPDPKDELGAYQSFLESYMNMQIGIASMEIDSLEKAVELLTKAVEQAPRNAAAHYFLGIAYRKSRQTDRAESAFEAALRIDPDFAEANIGLASILLNRGDTLGAASALDKVFRAERVTVPGLLWARRIWDRLGMAENAVRAMEMVLMMERDHVPARLYLAEHCLVNGDYDGAFDYLEPLEGILSDADSLSARVHYGLGRCYYHRGDLVKAEDLFRRVVTIDSTSADAYNQLGLVYDDLEEYEMAIASYRRALELDPDFVEVHSNLGVTYFNMGRYRKSLDEFETYLPHAENIEERERLKRLMEEIRQMEGNGG